MAVTTSRRTVSEEQSNSLVLSYLGIRRAIGMLGMSLPVILGPGGYLLFDIPWQQNMSSYYHTQMRDFFVGSVCSIGVFFVCYRGHNRFENWIANLTCTSAFGVALLPIDSGRDPLDQNTWAGVGHTLCGGIFFLMLAVFSLWILPVGWPKLALRDRKFQRHVAYVGSGIAILGSLAIMALHLFVLQGSVRNVFEKFHAIFWLEWIAVWAFGVAWLIKGRTILRDL